MFYTCISVLSWLAKIADDIYSNWHWSSGKYRTKLVGIQHLQQCCFGTSTEWRRSQY